MIATHRVKDNSNNTIGFVLQDNSEFHNLYTIKKYIDRIKNLSIRKDGVVIAEKSLPIKKYSEILKGFYQQEKQKSPFDRDIQKELLHWKGNNHEKVLQLGGARQIGKTSELKKFALQNYDYLIYVDLTNDVGNFEGNVVKLIAGNRVGGSFGMVSNYTPMEYYCNIMDLPAFVDNSNTLLILDEIQTNSYVYNSIRSLRSRLSCDIIVTGSYLGFTRNKNFFLPAGTIQYISMFPLSFSEFCGVFGKEENLKNINIYGEHNVVIFSELKELYDVYRQIGGFPDVVKKYIKTRSISDCMSVIESLLHTFETESGAYFENERETLIFDAVYRQAIIDMSKEKRGAGSRLVEDVTKIVKQSQKMLLSRDEVSKAVSWLLLSGVLGSCDLCLDGDITSVLPSRRLYYQDCGLARFVGISASLDNRDLEGILTETFVFTELNRLYSPMFNRRKVRGKTPYFSLLGDYELDFVVVDTEGNTYGIEAKTNRGTTKSLTEFMKRGKLDRAIVARNTNGGCSENYDTIPIFTVGCRFPYEKSNLL